MILVSLILLAAIVVLLAGLAYRVFQYWRTPVPFNITGMPAPKTKVGVFGRMMRETFFFHSLFRASKWTWVFSWLMHAALVLLLLKHLYYLLETTPLWLAWLMSIGHWLFAAFIIGLAGLFLRRILINRIRYISSPSDYLMLLLLGGIAVSGYSMHLGEAVNIAVVKQYASGLLRFEFLPFPEDMRLIIHLMLVAVLFFVFPFSKLLHAPGLFFSPTRNQSDNSRELAGD